MYPLSSKPTTSAFLAYIPERANTFVFPPHVAPQFPVSHFLPRFLP